MVTMAVKLPLVFRTMPPREDIKEAARRLGRQARYFRGLFRDKRTPWRAKILMGAALAYFLSPIDILPDFIPVIGQLDDLVIVPFLFGLANRAVPQEVKDHYQAKFLDPAGA